jgi:VWFA-related protein
MRAFVTLVVTALVLVGALSAQVPRRPGQPPVPEAPPLPQFKSSVDVVHLDVSVLDRDRRPVRGLKPSDFTILEDGKPQQISVFEAVDIPEEEPPAAAWIREVAPDVRVNTDVQERRLFLVVMDDATIQSSGFAVNKAREVARKVVDSFGPSDLAAVVFTRDNRNAQDFTADRARLNAAVNKFTVGFRDMGAWDPETQTPVPGQDDGYFISSVNVLEEAIIALNSLPDRRKSIIYIGQGIPVNLEAQFAPEAGSQSPAAAATQKYLTMLQGTLKAQERVKTQMQRIFQRAARANVTIYTLDICGLRPFTGVAGNPPPTCIAGLETTYLKTVAENTGGRAVINTNEFDTGVKAIFEENASYYLLGFNPSGPRQDGKFRRLEVKVNRPDLTVRTRNGYEAEKAGDIAKRRAALAQSPAGVAVAGILPRSDLPMQVTAVPFAIPGRKESAVAVTVGIRQPIRQNHARAVERVDLLVSAFGVEGKAFGSRRLTATVAIRAGASGLAEYEVLSRIDLKPGRYQLRIGASVGSLSTQGSVYYDVDVPDFSSSALSLSGIVLSGPGSGEVAPRDALASVMPVIPTSRRAFTAGQQVSAFIRVYQGGDGPLVAVPMRVSLVDSNGAVVMDRRQDLAVAQFTKARAANIVVPVPIDRLAAGEYLLTLEATSSGTLARRHTRIHVRPGPQPQ